MIRKGCLALLSAITLTNCTDQFSAVQQMNKFDEIPVGITEELHLIYSDSARIEAELIAPINIDFTNQKFPYSEFPQGLDATLYGNRGDVTFVRSDYGIYYPKTEIIDLRGNVVISDSTGTRLNTSQLYWDAGQEWLFTRKKLYFYQCIV
jgi:LPS export ABC transporter protein LptC